MITIYRKNALVNGVQEIEFRGLSTDEKPTEVDGHEIINGTAFVEIDTQNIYFYDEENDTWGD